MVRVDADGLHNLMLSGFPDLHPRRMDVYPFGCGFFHGMAVMKIYLAGKIGFRDWRHDVVDGLCNADLETRVIKRAIRNRHDYVGPFFIDGQHGSGHGDGTHGAGETHYNKNTHTNEVRPNEYVWENCISGIQRCDVFIAVVADDAHGTLCEIGYAYGIKKRVFVIGSQGKDCWFSKGFCCQGFEHNAYDSVESVLDWCDERDDYAAFLEACESPAETAFATELVCSRQKFYDRPQPQFMVGPYRLDFAFPKVRLAVEIDGIEFHGNQSAFMSDRKRTRFLESQGWRVMRFAAKEVLAAGPCEDCANEVWDAVASLQIENAEKQRQIEALNEWEAKRALSEA